jgi:hypothetical protein
MSKDITTYLKIYPNWLDEDKCKQTIEDLDMCGHWEKHVFYNAITNSEHPLSGDNELEVTWTNLVRTREYIMQRIWDALNEYVKELNIGWFDGWQGYTGVIFNRYSVGQTMAYHCDHIHSIFDGERRGIPVLSFVATLNDNFKGGEFVMWDDKIIKMKAGTVIIFPSCFLYPHTVKPVIEGTRYSCVSWAW